MEFIDYANMHDMLKQTVDRYGDNSAYKWFTEPGKTDSLTWNQFYGQVRKVGKSLMALGVEKGDKVNILSYSCYRWVLCDLGITSIGAVTVGIYQSNLPKDCQYIIDHSDAVVYLPKTTSRWTNCSKYGRRFPMSAKSSSSAGMRRMMTG
jgi:long-chain acyl-CoA synthetase